MEFRETLLAAQRNAQNKSSESSYYKARFDPPKKEEKKQKDKLSANIQKFLAKKEDEEKRKKLEAERKRDELMAMRDPKAIRKIQKSLKVIKSANKSVIADAIDTENTAITRAGPDQPDQDDYGYESQEAAALYEKMMQKYSKIPDEPKFSIANKSSKKDLNGTRERVKHALKHEDDPVPHKRRRRKENDGMEGDLSPSSKDETVKPPEKSEKSKIRKPMPPPIDFQQLLKLAEQKKSEPLEVAKKIVTESETGRPMTKKQRMEYEEELARRQRRQERLDAEKSGSRKIVKDERPAPAVGVKERKPEPSGFGRIPKLGDKPNEKTNKTESSKPSERPSDRGSSSKLSDRERQEMEKIEKLQRERVQLEKEKAERDRLEKLIAERERIERDINRLKSDRERIEKTKPKVESSKSSRPIDRVEDKSKLKSQSSCRLDKNSNEKKLALPNGDKRIFPSASSQGKPVSKLNKDSVVKDKIVAKQRLDGSPSLNGYSKVHRKPDDKKVVPGAKPQAAASNSFDFDKHVKSLGVNGTRPGEKNGVRPSLSNDKRRPDDGKRMPKRRAVQSDSEYDSEMDDFIDDDDDKEDYSRHIKEIFGYDRSKYRNIDDDDDPSMVSSFAQQQREEFISKKYGIMEDLEDMRLEAMEKKKSGKKRRRLSDD